MNNLPNWAKWLIIIAAVAVLAAVAFWLNDYVTRVEQPAPDQGLFSASSEVE